MAIPFAGVALGWYLFLPHLKWLELTGEYRSQAMIHLFQLKDAAYSWRYQLLTPRMVKEWDKCMMWESFDSYNAKAFGTFNKESERITEPDPKFVDKGLDQYKLEYCGPKPSR